MADEIILAPRIIDNNVVEGEVHLQMHSDVTKDIEIIMPNKNSRYITRESLESGELSMSILNGINILKPVNNEPASNGTFKVSTYGSSPTYDGVPIGYILELSTNINFSNIIKTFNRSDFNTEFKSTFEQGGLILYARAKVYTDLHISNSSPIVRFKLLDNYVHKTKILSPVNGTTNMAWEIIVNVDEYEYIGEDNYCEALTYELSTHPQFITIERSEILWRTENKGSVLNEGDYIRNFELKDLKENTQYYLRVAYIGKEYGKGEWSDAVGFKTYDLPDSKLTTTDNLYPNVIIDTENNKRIMFYSKAKSINISTYDNKYNHISTKTINLTGTYIVDTIIKKVLEDENNFYIFGVIQYGGNYVGPLQKDFVTRINKTFTTAKTVSIEVTEDLAVDGDGKLIPYVSNVDIKDVITYKDQFVIAGTIPHPANKTSVITSYYRMNKELNIVEFKNFNKNSFFNINKLVNTQHGIFGVGDTIVDIGSGPIKYTIVVKFSLDDGVIQLLANKIISVGTASIGSTSIISIGDEIVVGFNISGRYHNVYMDEYLNVVASGSFTSIFVNAIKQIDTNRIRAIGDISGKGAILDINTANKNILAVSKTKQFNNNITFLAQSDILNNIALFGTTKETLCLNDDLNVVGTGISSPTITYSNSTPVLSSITVESVTNEPIVEPITSTIVNGSNKITKTTIS